MKAVHDHDILIVAGFIFGLDHDDEGVFERTLRFWQAARLVVSSRKASASYIQRKLRLGYARSARLLDMMEQEGVVGPSQGSRGREVLAPPDYFGEVDATLQDDGEEDPSDG